MSRICKWGNSLGLRLPASIAQLAGLKSGTSVSVRLLDNGAILVTALSHVAPVGGTHLVTKTNKAPREW